MNMRELVVPFALALATAWLIQRFILNRFFGSPQSKTTTTEFVAPESEQAYKPLNTEIDFIDREKPRAEQLTEVETSWGVVTFSNHGGSLYSCDFDHAVNGKKESIRTIFPSNDAQRETGCLLIALNEPTPYYFELHEQQDESDRVILEYHARFSRGILIKIFTVHKHKHQIDFSCDVRLSDGLQEALELRIFYPSPFMVERVEDVISSTVINSQNAFERTNRASLDIRKGWFSPSLFGAENAYFIHTLIGDEDSFVQRAYYKFTDKQKLISVLEGPAIIESSSWNMSFYFGPKTQDAVVAVDERLEQTLAYAGVFAPISRLFLKILKFIFDYVGNYGFAIMLLTLLIKLVMFPLSLRGESGMQNTQKMQQEMAFLKVRYANEPQKLAQEQAALIKKYGLPGVGCLPLLLQIPVFIAMRSVLSNALELHHAPMLWISDLSARDPYFILPMLLVLGMFIQAAYAEQSQRMMLIAMGLVLGAFMANFSAGLVLYFVVHSVLTLVQTRFVRYMKRA